MAERYNHPVSTGCYEIDLKIFSPTPSDSEAVRALTARRKFITITVQRFLRRKRIKEHLRVSASLFLISQ
jgi:hypothetical protein